MSTPAPEPAAAETSTAPDNGGFVESLDSFFASMDNPVEPTPEPVKESKPEPVKESAIETPAESNPLSDLESLEEPKDWTPQAANGLRN